MIRVMHDVVGVRFSASQRGRKAEVMVRKPQIVCSYSVMSKSTERFGA
jgi:hypothetical protein